MADNVTANAGSGGSTFASDDIGGVHYPRAKVTWGPDGTANDADDATDKRLPVKVGDALPAGTNAIGKLAANSGVDIGDVDVTSITPGTAAGSLGKAEDAAHASGDTGVMALAVRKDTAAQTSGTDGDYCPLISDSTGRLHVNVGNSVTVAAHDVSNAGIFAVQENGAALTSLQLLDDIVRGEDSASADGHAGAVVMAVRQDTPAGSTSTDGDYTTFKSDSVGRLHVNVGNTVTVASHAVTNAGTFVVQESGAALTALQLIDDAVYAEDVASVAGDKGLAILAIRQNADTTLVGTDLDYANLQVDTRGCLKVEVFDGGDSHTVDDGGGSITVDGTVTAANAAGDIAHDATDSGNPVKQGFKATTALSGLTLVANADRTDAYAGVDGVQIVRPHCNLEDIVSGNASNTDGTSTQVIAAGGSGVKQYLTSVALTNMSATGIYVEIKSGTTVKATIPLPANSGAIFNPPVPLPPNAANEAWNFDPSAAATTVYCSMIGFKSKV